MKDKDKRKKTERKAGKGMGTQGGKHFGQILFSSWWPIFLVVILFLIVVTDLLYAMEYASETNIFSLNVNQQANDLEELRINYEKEAQENSTAAYENAMTAMKYYVDVSMNNSGDEYVCDRQMNVVAERTDSLYLIYVDENAAHYYICADDDMKKRVLGAYEAQKQGSGLTSTVRINEAYIKGSECYPISVNIYSVDTNLDEQGNEELCYHLEETIISSNKPESDYDDYLTGLDVLEDGRTMLDGLQEIKNRKETGIYYMTAVFSVMEEAPRVRQDVEELMLGDMVAYEDAAATAIEFQGYDNKHYMAAVIPVWFGEEQFYYVMISSQQPMQTVGRYIIAAWVIGILASVLMALVIAKGFARTMKKEQELVCRQRDYTNALAHDLKTPLMAISGYTENLQSNANPEKQEHYYEAIYSNIDYMNRLIMDMLNLAKLQRSKEALCKDKVDLRSMTEKVVSYYEQELREKDLHLKIKGNGIWEADSKLLERALKNLIENAVKYSPVGEAVVIQITDGSFQIKNTGVSLPKEKWNAVFQPFVKGDETRERDSGSGLGLTIVRDIAKLHGFKCRLECTENATIVTLEA